MMTERTGRCAAALAVQGFLQSDPSARVAHAESLSEALAWEQLEAQVAMWDGAEPPLAAAEGSS